MTPIVLGCGFKLTRKVVLGYKGLGQMVGEQGRGLYPVPQNALCAGAGMNGLNSLQGRRPKAADKSPWYGVYRLSTEWS